MSQTEKDGWPGVFQGMQERLDHQNEKTPLADRGEGEFYQQMKQVYELIIKNTATTDALKMFLNGDYFLLHLIFLLEIWLLCFVHSTCCICL